MKIYIDNYDISLLKTKLNKLSNYKNNIQKKDNVFLKVITKENGIYNIYTNNIYKISENYVDINKITFINNYYNGFNLILDNNIPEYIETFSCIPLPHFYMKTVYAKYSLNGKASNVILVIEYIVSSNNNIKNEKYDDGCENFIPVDFFFELRNNELSTFNDDDIKEEFNRFLDILS